MSKFQGSAWDLDGAQLQNAVLHNITGSGDWSDTIGGIVGFMSANDDKRIAFWDDQISSLIKVPRLDRAETVTGVWNLSNNFTVGSSTVITNLNADLLDGYNSSTSATQNTIPVYGTGGVLNVATPTAAGHAATKGYVDSAVEGLDIKASCRVATTGSIADLSAVTVATIDSVTLVEGDRVLVKDTASPDGIEALHAKYNGIYVVGVVSVGVAPLTRASDADTDADVTSGMYTFIGEGSTHGNQGWTLTTDDPITLGTTALTFEQFSGAGQITAGNGIDKTGDTLSLKVGGATTWTQGDILYADSTTTINGSGALSGILQGNGASAPTGIAGTQYGLPYFATTTTVASTGAGTTTQVLHGSGAGSPTWGAVSLTADVSGTLPVGNGGTGAITLADGGLVIGNGTSAVEVVAAGLTTQILVGGGALTAPVWGTDLPTAVTIGTAYVYRVGGTDVSVADGGTGLSAWTANGILYASGTTTLANGSALTWDGSTLGVDGDLAFTGPQSITTSSGNLVLNPAANVLLNYGGTTQFYTVASGIEGWATGSARIVNAAASATVPTLVPASNASTTGIGGVATTLHFITDGTSRWSIPNASTLTGNGPATIATSSGALTLAPASGSNLNITTSGAGDVAINTNQFYVDSSTGFVGVGTSGPGSVFHVKPVAEGNLWVRPYSAIATAAAGVGIDTLNDAANALSPLAIRGATVRLMDTSGFVLTLDGSGNVGIGTTAPTSSIIGGSPILDITDSTGTNPVLTMHVASSTQEFSIHNNGSGSYIDTLGAATASDNFLQFRTSNTNSDYSTYVNALRITSGGNVGIGTTAPGQKLTVIGSIALGSSDANQSSRIEVADVSSGASDARFLFRNGTDTDAALRLIFNDATSITIDAVQANNSATVKDIGFQPNGGNVGIGTTGPASKLDVLTASLGVTQTNTSGLLLSTSTAAAAGAQQISPALRWRGYGWKTDATAASQSVDFRAYILPVEGAAAPTAALVFESSINGGAYAEVARFNSGGAITSATSPNVARIKTFTIGNGSDTTLTCTHSFSTRDVQVEVYRVASPYDTIYPDVERVSTSAVDIKFRTAPSSGEYSVVITA